MYHSVTTHGDRVTSFEAGRFLLYLSSYSAATALPRHYHDLAALTFSTRGAFAETVARRTFECDAFDAIVRPAGAAHTNRYGPGGAFCVIVNIPRELAVLDAPAKLPREAAVPVARRVARELEAADADSPSVVEGLLLELLAVPERSSRAADAPPWLARTRDYIHAHLPERPALEDIARAGDVHPASLVRAFRRHLRCSPGEYMRRLRLEQAHDALVATARPIAEIALEAGFYDQSHFTNAFRRTFGVTPARIAERRRPGG